MDFNFINKNDQLYLTKAILLYESGNRSSKGPSFATCHSVVDSGTTKRPKPEIQAGTPMTKQAVLMTMASLSESFELSAEILPAHVISYSPMHLTWWMPSGTRNTFFNSSGIGKRSGRVAHPPLLFMVIGDHWYVYALKDDVHPGPETELFNAPYFNVYDSSEICKGTSAVPGTVKPSSIPLWEEAFSSSEFTSAHGTTKKTSYKGGLPALWRDLLDGKFDRFPTDSLVSRKMTLSAAMRSVQRLMEDV